jgi:hypothetical protein
MGTADQTSPGLLARRCPLPQASLEEMFGRLVAFSRRFVRGVVGGSDLSCSTIHDSIEVRRPGLRMLQLLANFILGHWRVYEMRMF